MTDLLLPVFTCMWTQGCTSWTRCVVILEFSRPMEIHNTPVCGGTVPRGAWRTAHKLAEFALQHVNSLAVAPGSSRYLDVGCGNGFVTEIVARKFDEVVGIDIEPQRLDDFRANASTNYGILLMSAAEMQFASNYFSFVTAFEVLEHVSDLNASVTEIVRVCAPGGIVVISVPQVGFPFENHGARFGNRTYARKIPLLPYIRPLHRKYSLARVFSSAELDLLFVPRGMELLMTAYAAPKFERSAERHEAWERNFVWLRSILDWCEAVPVLRALTGVSLLKAYRKRCQGCSGLVHNETQSCMVSTSNV